MVDQVLTAPVQQGVIVDESPYSVKPEVWTSGQNIQFTDGKTQKRRGYSQVYGQLGPSSTDIAPYWNMPWTDGATDYWIYASATNVYKMSTGSTRTSITHAAGAYTSNAEKWNGTVLGGVAYVNNGKEVPQYLAQNSSQLVDIDDAGGETNFPSTYTAVKTLRSFKNFLVAMNITVSGTQKKNLVGWSNPISDFNTLPTWDLTDAAQDAGETELGSSDGKVLDGQSLKDSFIIYKEDAVWSMQHIGGDYVFKFTNLFDDVGMLTDSCVATFDGKHFVVGRDDVYVHNGVTKKSVISRRMRKFLFNRIEPLKLARTFVVPNYTANEMWICYVPTGGTGATDYPTQALVWNWLDDTWSGDVAIAKSSFATFGVVNDTDAVTDWGKAYAGTDVSFTSASTITTASDTSVTLAGITFIAVSGSTSNDGYYTVTNISGTGPTVFTVSETSITTESAGDSVILNGSAELTRSWDGDATSWDESTYNPTNRKLIFCAPVAQKMYEGNSSNQADGTSYLAQVEKIGVNIGTTEKIKYISGVIPRISGSGNINIYVGGEMSPNAGVAWDGPFSFEIGVDYKADLRVSGRYAAIKFESTDSNTWALAGYDFIVDKESDK